MKVSLKLTSETVYYHNCQRIFHTFWKIKFCTRTLKSDKRKLLFFLLKLDFFCIWPWHLNFDMTVQNVRGGLALALTRSEHSENGWKLKCWPTCGGILLLANGLENLSIPCWKYPWQSSSKHHRKGYTVKQKKRGACIKPKISDKDCRH